MKKPKVKVEDPMAAKRKILKFKVDGFRKKMILLRQHKIQKDTYLRKFVTRNLSKAFPLSL
jgi:hypothetical protein